MNDPWARGPIGKLREKATLRARRPRWRPRWSSNFAWPPPFPVRRVKEKKKKVREMARRTRKRKRQETGRKKVQKNEQLVVKVREEGRALHHRACRPFRRGVWLRDIKMYWLYVAEHPRAHGVVKETHWRWEKEREREREAESDLFVKSLNGRHDRHTAMTRQVWCQTITAIIVLKSNLKKLRTLFFLNNK